MPEQERTCIPALGLSPANAAKALSENNMIPDGLSDATERAKSD
jgi:hypothetical protein